MTGLGSRMGVGLPISNGPSKAVASPVPQHVVFVDKAELAKLHPSWQALNAMRAALGETAKLAGKGGKGTVPVRSRTALAARAAMKATRALAELQERKLEALRVRAEAMRSQKMQSAELDWKADARVIEQSAAAEAKGVDAKYSPDLLNARLKAMAAQALHKAASKDGSGMDRAAADDILRANEDRLAAAAAADDAEKKAISDAAAQRIDALRQASAKRVEEEVLAYEREQSRLILNGIDAAKDELARQMGPDAMLIARAGLAEQGSAQGGASVETTGGLEELQAAAAALQARIQKDVDVAVRELAASSGLAVVFERRKSTPDATGKFVNLIKKRGWNACGPLETGVESS